VASRLGEYRGHVKRGLPQLATPPPEHLRLGLDALRWYFAPE